MNTMIKELAPPSFLPFFKLAIFAYLLSFPLIPHAATDFCQQHADAIFCEDFQQHQQGNYSETQLKKDWPNLRALSKKHNIFSLGLKEERVHIVDKNNNQQLAISYPKNKFGSADTGATWIMDLPPKANKEPYQTISFEYKIIFKKGFLFSRSGLFGGKLPGIMGGKTISGGAKPDGHNGWTSRVMWGQKGRGLGYVYYPDMRSDKHNQFACPRYGLDSEYCVIYRNKYFSSQKRAKKKCLSEWAAYPYDLRFKTEKVYTIKQQITMNSLPQSVLNGDKTVEGNRDGSLKFWVNGTLMLNCNAMRFRDTPALAIDAIIINTFFGGNTPESSAHPADEIIYFDDFWVRAE